jgi:cephalosporin hydroxylase
MPGLRERAAWRLNKRRLERASRLVYEWGTWGDTRWLDATVAKNPLDLWVMQEIIAETRPEVIVETGTYRGGSALFFASLCELLGEGEVISVDIEPPRDDYPAHPRITYLAGRSSTEAGVVEQVRACIRERRTMVILDSDHSAEHVAAELAAYAPLVSIGCYLIVEDTNVDDVRPDLPTGPLVAIQDFLSETDDFVVDSAREKWVITFNPGGYLKRVA